MRSDLRVLSLVAGLVFALGAISAASAQPPPPNRYFGPATLNGAPAAVGTPVLAFIGGNQCGAGQVQSDGRYVVDVDDAGKTAGCGTDGATITFRVGGVQAAQTGSFMRGTFTMLALTAPGGASPPPPARFSEAFLDLADPRPCMPAPCDATRAALWNGDEAAWSARGVTDPDARFGEIIVLRVQAGEPSVISNIARILGNPYLQITRLHFGGSGGTEFVEITNLGGGDQDMSGWVVIAPSSNTEVGFPAGYVMNPAQSCRIYSGGAVRSDSCGTTAFAGADLWPDGSGNAVLFFRALNLPGADRRYNADPAAQPAEPDLQGVGV